MFVDHGGYNSPESERPVFLDVSPAMTVIVKHDFLTGEKRDKDWWTHNLFQIADVDSGAICWVKVDLLTHHLHRADHQMVSAS